MTMEKSSHLCNPTPQALAKTIPKLKSAIKFSTEINTKIPTTGKPHPQTSKLHGGQKLRYRLTANVSGGTPQKH